MAFPLTLTPVLATAGIGWMYYRRIRRQFGRQQYKPRRALLRLGLLALVMIGLLVMCLQGMQIALGVGIGLAIGIALALLSLRHTTLECVDDTCWYTPHPWIGAALSVLLVGRLAWRFGHGGMLGGGMTQAQSASPLTLGIAAVLIGYYLVNGTGLTLRMRGLRASAARPSMQAH